MNTDQHRSRTVLERSPAEAQRARREVAEVCDGVPEDVLGTAQLLTSELFTNALDHGHGAITLEVVCLPDSLLVEVSDANPERPQVKPMTVNDVRGRGLMIMDALAEDWGVEPAEDGQGKKVWFKLRTTD